MNKSKLILVIFILIAAIVLISVYLKNQKKSLSENLANVLSPEVTNSALLSDQPTFQINSSSVNYFANSQGFFAEPKEKGNFPGVVMIHEWWGLNDNIKKMAENLAGSGYRVLAVDLYNGKIAKTQDEAKTLTSSLDKTQAIENMKAALKFLRDKGAVKTASLGWCFGGGQSLQLALSGAQMDATVVYYGTLETDENKLKSINWPVLGIFGDKDQSIPVAKVREFDKSLDNLKIVNEIYIYPGVGHAFANPSGDNFAPDETKDAWNKTLTFLNKHLKGENGI